MFKYLVAALAVVSPCWFAVDVFAAPVSVGDPSFEDYNVGDDSVAPNGFSPVWTDVLSYYDGINDPKSEQIPGTDGNDVQGNLPDGGQCYFVASSNAISQTLNEAVVPGNQYTLAFYVGHRIGDAWGGYHATLTTTGGDTIIDVSGSTDPGLGLFSQVSLPGTALETASGNLQISFDTSLGGNTCFDLVTLQVVPEPSTFALATLGLLSFLAFAWRRRMR